MPKDNSKSKTSNFIFPKSLTGIHGLDDITTGGLPKNRPTLLLGNTGCGKTIMAMEFLVNGIEMYNEPGVFIAFEEKTAELAMNVKSLGYELDAHVADNKMYLEYVQINRNEILETGEYGIEGLFVRLGHAIDKVKAKRVVLDSLDTLFLQLRLPGAPFRIQKAFFLVKRKESNSNNYRGNRGYLSYPPWPGRVCGRLCNSAGQPGNQPDHYPAPAGDKIPWFYSRQQ